MWPSPQTPEARLPFQTLYRLREKTGDKLWKLRGIKRIKTRCDSRYEKRKLRTIGGESGKPEKHSQRQNSLSPWVPHRLHKSAELPGGAKGRQTFDARFEQRPVYSGVLWNPVHAIAQTGQLRRAEAGQGGEQPRVFRFITGAFGVGRPANPENGLDVAAWLCSFTRRAATAG